MHTPPSDTEKKQGSLVEFLIVIVIVMLLMKLLLDIFFSQQDKITNTLFVTMAQNFTTKVNVVHAQWLMDEQPNVVLLVKGANKIKESIKVNKLGWIDSEHKSEACNNIWQQAVGFPLKIVKSPVFAVEIQHKTFKTGRLCRYSIANGQSFDYRSDTGKVMQVN